MIPVHLGVWLYYFFFFVLSHGYWLDQGTSEKRIERGGHSWREKGGIVQRGKETREKM